MAFQITREQVWFAAIADQPGTLAELLGALAVGGVSLEFVIARREMPGRVLVFISPLRTAEDVETARKAGFYEADGLHSVRVAGPDRAGLVVEIASALAAAHINIRGVSAAALGERQVMNVAFDTAADADAGKVVLAEKFS